MTQSVSELNSKLPSFKNVHEPNNEQLVFKSDSGFMLLSGTWQANNGVYSATNAVYNYDVKFEIPFANDDILVFTSARYAGGIPKVTTVWQNKSSARMACDVNVQGVWINWLAIGRCI